MSFLSGSQIRRQNKMLCFFKISFKYFFYISENKISLLQICFLCLSFSSLHPGFQAAQALRNTSVGVLIRAVKLLTHRNTIIINSCFTQEEEMCVLWSV